MRALMLIVLLMLGTPTAQAAPVVAETTTTGEWGVAALQARLDASHHYTVQVDGPAGAAFTARYMQVYVSRQPSNGGSGNDDGSFQGNVPYEQDLTPPAAGLIFWRYSVVVSPTDPAQLVVRVIDQGPR